MKVNGKLMEIEPSGIYSKSNFEENLEKLIEDAYSYICLQEYQGIKEIKTIHTVSYNNENFRSKTNVVYQDESKPSIIHKNISKNNAIVNSRINNVEDIEKDLYKTEPTPQNRFGPATLSSLGINNTIKEKAFNITTNENLINATSSGNPTSEANSEISNTVQFLIQWNELKSFADKCNLCKLHLVREKVIFGKGKQESPVWILEGIPNEDNELHNEPFAGASGELLSKILLTTLAIKIEDVYMTNLVKCCQQKRLVTLSEVKQCVSSILNKQIDLYKPKCILVLGEKVAQFILQTKENMNDIHAKWGSFSGIPVYPTFHPNDLIIDSSKKRIVYEDMKKLKLWINQYKILL